MRPRSRAHNQVGFTDLIGEKNVSKCDQRIKAIGAVDEASAALGLARSFMNDSDDKIILINAQKDLSMIMATLAGDSRFTISAAEKPASLSLALNWIEEAIIGLENKVDYPKAFTISGDTPASGTLNLARAVVRRSEREVTELYQLQGPVNETVAQYLNRLSTLCYLLELKTAH